MTQDSSQRDRLMGHQYDGIEEYDNPLPGWWKWTFIGSAVFALCYFVYYHAGGSGASEVEAYEAEMAAFFKEQAERGAALNVNAEMIAMLAKSKEAMGVTRNLFVSKCAQCHGALGEGKIGPNLTDRYFVHGHEPMDIYKTICDGVPEKGMQAWGKLLKPQEVVNLAAYVLGLPATSPTGGKKPEGKKVE